MTYLWKWKIKSLVYIFRISTEISRQILPCTSIVLNQTTLIVSILISFFFPSKDGGEDTLKM